MEYIKEQRGIDFQNMRDIRIYLTEEQIKYIKRCSEINKKSVSETIREIVSREMRNSRKSEIEKIRGSLR